MVAMSTWDIFLDQQRFCLEPHRFREKLLETARGNAALARHKGSPSNCLSLQFSSTIRAQWSIRDDGSIQLDWRSRCQMARTNYSRVSTVVVLYVQVSHQGIFYKSSVRLVLGNICYFSPYPLLCGLFHACTRGRSAHFSTRTEKSVTCAFLGFHPSLF